MKKKISMVLAGLGLCASMMMFSAQEANATKDYPLEHWYDVSIYNCLVAGKTCHAS